ncbi:MAG: hypothetical protein NTX87_06575 [Planctomycetota bacterium]|nr:hypothetical protein [Planctomycetota bacterium]
MAKHTNQDYLTIFQSELQVICAIAIARGRCEIGGICFGVRSRGGRFIIFYVTGPGPNATHAYARFQQDVGFFHQVVPTVEGLYGVQYTGDWHSHHFLQLDHPSFGDLSQVESVCRDNNFAQWMGLITTFDGDRPEKGRYDLGEADDPEKARGSAKVRVNAFLYDTDGGFRRCSIRVLKTMSPVRLALLAAGRQDLGGVGNFAPSFPLDRISYDAYADHSQEAKGIPGTLVEQLRGLAELGLKEDVGLSVAGDTVKVALPLPAEGRAEVVVNLADPHAVEHVRLRHRPDDDFEDIRINPLHATLVEVYGRLASLHGESQADPSRTDKCVGILSTLRDRTSPSTGSLRHGAKPSETER